MAEKKGEIIKTSFLISWAVKYDRKKKLTYTKGKFWVKYTYKKDIAILNKILV